MVYHIMLIMRSIRICFLYAKNTYGLGSTSVEVLEGSAYTLKNGCGRYLMLGLGRPH